MFGFDSIGTYTYGSGGRTEGHWKNAQMHGKGKVVFRDGGTFEGDYYLDYEHGYGVCIYPDGATYEGSWQEGKKSGYGKYLYQGGDKYGFSFKRIGLLKKEIKVGGVLGVAHFFNQLFHRRPLPSPDLR